MKRGPEPAEVQRHYRRCVASLRPGWLRLARLKEPDIYAHVVILSAAKNLYSDYFRDEACGETATTVAGLREPEAAARQPDG